MSAEFEFVNEKLEYLRLTDDQYAKLGKIVHSISELDVALVVLGAHLRTLDAPDSTKFNRTFRTQFGIPGSIQYVRDAIGKQPQSMQHTIGLLLEICEELFDRRNAIAHGYPRKDGNGMPYMWRRNTNRKSPMYDKNVALPIDGVSLELTIADIRAAQHQLTVLTHYFWPRFRGENPYPDYASEVPANGVGRVEVLYPELMQKLLEAKEAQEASVAQSNANDVVAKDSL